MNFTETNPTNGMANDGARARLLATAECLFAEHGVKNVSLREVTRRAGARNVVAVQYHFTDRDGLVQAILAKHRPAVEALRHQLLDAAEAATTIDLRSLSTALVRPFAIKLADNDGGPEFLRIFSELLNQPRPLLEAVSLHSPGHSLYRWRRMLDPLLDDEAVDLRRDFMAVSLTITELGRRAGAEGRTDHRLFTSTLVDYVVAILSAKASDETAELLADRTRRTGRPPRRAAP